MEKKYQKYHEIKMHPEISNALDTIEDVFGYWHTVTRVEENSVKPFEAKLTILNLS